MLILLLQKLGRKELKSSNIFLLDVLNVKILLYLVCFQVNIRLLRVLGQVFRGRSVHTQCSACLQLYFWLRGQALIECHPGARSHFLTGSDFLALPFETFLQILGSGLNVGHQESSFQLSVRSFAKLEILVRFAL